MLCAAQRYATMCRGVLRQLVIDGTATGLWLCGWHEQKFVESFAPIVEWYEEDRATGRRRYIIQPEGVAA